MVLRLFAVSRGVVLAGLAFVLLMAWARAYAQESASNLTEIQSAIARDGQANVIVEMMMPEAAPLPEEPRNLERRNAAPVENTPEVVREKVARTRAAVSSMARDMSGRLGQANIAIKQSYDHLPMFVTTLDAAGLERLMRVEGIKAVYLDKPLARRSVALPAAVLEKVAVTDAIPETAQSAPIANAATEHATRTAAVAESSSDDPSKALLSTTVTYINADDAWARGFTGQNQSIAILDDGIERTHDMFVGKIVAEACYSTKVRSDDVALCPGGATSSTATGAASNCSAGPEVCQHGSHVAGIAAGNDTIGSTTLRGVAYGANLIPIQVFTLSNNQSDCDNAAPCLITYSSAVLNGLNYAISQAAARNLASVNLSLGGSTEPGFCDSDSRKTAIDTLRNLGVLTTISAGNDGALGQVARPGCISSAITTSSVIITVPDNGVNHAVMVDVLAPGVLVRSANVNNSYITRSGTSMAAPHVAGAIAILKSSKPTATAAELEAALENGGIQTSLSSWTFTTPRIDVNKSLDLLGSGAAISGVAVPGVFGSANTTGTSFLRFFNVDSATANVTVQIYNDATGTQVGTWTRQIRGFSSPQINMATIEAESVPPIAPVASTSQFYTLFVDAPFTGYLQHVLWSPQTNILSNVSGCDNGLADAGRFINNTHTTLISGYTSFVLVHNSGSTDAKPSFDVRDARDGAQIGTFTTAGNIKAHSSNLIKVSDVLQTLGRTPDSSQYHLNLIMSTTGFTGFAQHWVQNEALGIITSIAAKCDI